LLDIPLCRTIKSRWRSY